MEHLAPQLELIFWLQQHLGNGASVRHAVQQFVGSRPQSVLKGHLLVLLRAGKLGPDATLEPLKLIESKALMRLIEVGLAGYPISNQLKNLETEVIQWMNIELDKFVQRLPFLMMMPIMLFLVPAYLIVVLGPMLGQFMRGLQ